MRGDAEHSPVVCQKRGGRFNKKKRSTSSSRTAECIRLYAGEDTEPTETS